MSGDRSNTTPRERAIRALYGPHCNPADIQPGAVTEAIEAAIVAACEDHPTCPELPDAAREVMIRRVFGWRPEKEWDQTFLLRLLDEARNVTDHPRTTDELPTARQSEAITYGAECPSCGEWHEECYRLVGKIIDCICGVKFRVTK